MRFAPPLLFAFVYFLAVDDALAASPTIVFPKDESVIDVKRDCGAVGDGKADDTGALQKGIDASCGADGSRTRVVYLPNGKYRVTRTLVVKTALGPWLYGQSRDGVVIKLDDGVKDCNSVLRTHPNEKGPTSADWFMRNLRNFTIDVGNNPETDGIRYYATNTGMLSHVRVIGNGKVGVNAGFLDQSGPNLIQDVEIEGFETGILSQWIWGQSLSRITIKNCRKVGLRVSANSVAVERLIVANTPQAIICDIPEDWGHWAGVVALVGGRFSGGDKTLPAIENKGVMYVRDVKTQGFKQAVAGRGVPDDFRAADLPEWGSDESKHLFDGEQVADQPLVIRSEPPLDWEQDPAKWLCADDFGIDMHDNNQDDSAAFQKAIDAAAAAGKTVVYLRGTGGPEPNWYNLDGEVRVHGSVKAIVSLGWGRILGSTPGRFVIDDRSAPLVRFMNIDAFGGGPIALENRSAKNTLVADSCGVRILGAGQGDIFATNCPCTAELTKPGQEMWARQFNVEGTSDEALVNNAGGKLWVLGMKCEGVGTRIRTSDGGRTEVFGTFIYGPGLAADDRRPMFDVDNATLRLFGLREITFGTHCYHVKMREKQGDETRELGSDKEGGWIGWSQYCADRR